MKRILSGFLAAALAFASILPVAIPQAQAQQAVVDSLRNVINREATYTANANVTLASTPTEIFYLTGSATKTVFVREVSVQCTKTASGYVLAYLMKRSTATTGGTSAIPTVIPLDSSNSTATAVARSFTANPTVGTGVSIAQLYLPFISTATYTEPSVVKYRWGTGMEQSLILRGVAQAVAVNFGGGTTTGGVCNVHVTWMEQS